MSRLCPDDGSTLDRRAFHGLILDVCPLCAGIFFDEGEMAALQDAGAHALGEVEEATLPGLTFADCDEPKRCPSCHALMCAYAYRYSSDIRLDGCEKCGGVWVQDGELERVAVHLRGPSPALGGIPAARRHLLTLRSAAAFLPQTL